MFKAGFASPATSQEPRRLTPVDRGGRSSRSRPDGHAVPRSSAVPFGIDSVVGGGGEKEILQRSNVCSSCF